MDNIILGLLLMCNRTIYQLRDRISKGINLMYSSSMGSIQAAVKKLLNCGYISYEEIIDNGKYKKIYCITESGKLHFYEDVYKRQSGYSGVFKQEIQRHISEIFQLLKRGQSFDFFPYILEAFYDSIYNAFYTRFYQLILTAKMVIYKS